MTHIGWLSMAWVWFRLQKYGPLFLHGFLGPLAVPHWEKPQVLCEVGEPPRQPGTGIDGRSAARAFLEPLGNQGKMGIQAVQIEI